MDKTEKKKAKQAKKAARKKRSSEILLEIDQQVFDRTIPYLEDLQVPRRTIKSLKEDFIVYMALRKKLFRKGHTLNDVEAQQDILLKNNRWLITLKFWRRAVFGQGKTSKRGDRERLRETLKAIEECTIEQTIQ